ncbi:hypothetical protein R3P38DRAFT_2847300 [Favolaschia claudopus]|uniref:Uncharacterized protein n=1 Tax=Favolaschia claudopus TaxID=2862362 RepID=A0AAW0DW37_9AGAR
MSDIPPPYNHLQHLDQCEICFAAPDRPNQYMRTMKMSTGASNASNKGAWYQTCLSNPGPCTNFKWVQRERGPRKREDAAFRCPGRLCRDRPHARAGSNSCHIGLCAQCCVLAHQDTERIPACPVHDQALRKTGSALPTPSVPVVPSATPALPISAASTTLTPLTPTPRPKTFAIAISETYQNQIQELDDQQIQQVQSAAKARSYARQASVSATIQWWHKDDEQPDVIDVPAPNHYFHPLHSQMLIDMYSLSNNKLFETFDRVSNVWKVSSATTPPQHVEKGVALLYRSRGVKAGLGMPQGMVFGAPMVAPGRRETEGDYNADADSGLTAFLSGPPQTPSRSTPLSAPSKLNSPSPPCSATPSLTSSPATPISLFTLSPSPSFPSSSGTRPSLSISDNTLDVFGSTPIVPATTTTTNTTQITNEALRAVVESAVQGPAGWPFRFTRDMAAGWILFDRIKGSVKSRPNDFRAAFGHEYKNATFNDNRRIWDRACKEGNIDPLAIVSKDDRADTWKKFRARWPAK